MPNGLPFMQKILILFAHPAYEKSKAHHALLKSIAHLPGITVNDLYQNYPYFDIDIKKEQELLKQHQIIIWQHPFYWYSCPALLKQWIDLVLAHGWAYGKTGNQLSGKKIFNAITSGSKKEAYQHKDNDICTIKELLSPFELTATICKMKYYPPFWVPGTHKMLQEEIDEYGTHYRQLLISLRENLLPEEVILTADCLNDINMINKTID